MLNSRLRIFYRGTFYRVDSCFIFDKILNRFQIKDRESRFGRPNINR
jgi:hypothetical protein